MKGIKIIMAAAALLLAVSCSKSGDADRSFDTIYCNQGDLTRTYLDFNEYRLLWAEGDRVAVMTKRFHTGIDFTLAEGAGTAQAMFNSADIVNDTTVYYAISPASAAISSSYSEGNDVMYVNYPATIAFNPDTECGEGTNLMISKSTSKHFTFKNICAYLELVILGSDGDAMKTITISGKNGEIVSGTASVSFDGDEPSVAFASGGGKTLTMDFGEGGLAFDENDPLIVDIPVTPVLTNGFKMQFVTEYGISKTFTSSESAGLNALLFMPDVDLTSN